MNGFDGSVIGAWPASISRWFTTAPQALAAGDQITGCGPFVSGSGHPAASNAAPAPDALLLGRTNTHLSPTFAWSEPLNSFASSVISVIFSGDDAMSTTMQSPGSALERSSPLSPDPDDDEHAASVIAKTSARANAIARFTARPSRSVAERRSLRGRGAPSRRAARRPWSLPWQAGGQARAKRRPRARRALSRRRRCE